MFRFLGRIFLLKQLFDLFRSFRARRATRRRP
jgi:hypothetical protein